MAIPWDDFDGALIHLDTPCFRRFAGIDLIAEEVLEHVNQGPSAKGLLLKEGTILDATADRIHGRERMIYGDSGHIRIGKRKAFKDCSAEIRIARKAGQRRVLADTPEGKLLDLVESAKAHLRAKAEHPLRIIKHEFRLQKIYYRGIKNNDLKRKMLLALTNR